MARRDDAVIGGDEVLLGAIDDWPHAFLQRSILHGDACDAAISLAALLRRAVHQVVVVLVGERPIGAGLTGRMDAFALLHRLALGAREIARRMIVVAPSPAVVVVDRNPEVAMHRMATARRDHGE